MGVTAAIVWHTVVPPSTPAGASITFEAPGLGDVPRGVDVPVGVRPYQPGETSSAGSLDPLMATPPPQGVSEPLVGIASQPISITSGLTSVSTLTNSGLTTQSLFDRAGSGNAASPSSATARAADTLGDNLAATSSVVFAGLGASSVRSVVYVLDCSGPMVTSLPIVSRELKRSINKLSPNQRFNVVIFRRTSDELPAAETFAAELVRPTDSAQQLLADWLAAIEPSGRSSPLAGIELALTFKPDAIFVLSRSIQRSGGGVWDLGFTATLNRLEQLNPVLSGATRRSVLIQTIQFLDEDPTGTMQAIGTRHGDGVGYRVVKSQQDLGGKARGRAADEAVNPNPKQ